MPSNPPQPRSGSRPRRPSASVYRRRRLGVGLVALTLLIVGLVLITDGSGGSKPKAKDAKASSDQRRTTAAAERTNTPAVPAIEAGLMPWSLSNPLSRMQVYPASGGLVLAGGLTLGQSSADGVYALNTGTGNLHQIGTLVHGVHDAAGAVVAGSYTLFGGGSPATVATVQSFTNGAPSVGSPLPTPRSDATAVTAAGTTYVVGGFDGTNPTPSVLATTDGRTFTSVADLAVPVRYPAVAVVDGAVYLFGGVSTGQGTDTAAIQRYDPATQTTRVVAQLPAPLSHATAVPLGGAVYLLGGFVNNAVSAQVLRVDVPTGAVTPAGTLPTPLTDAAAVVVGGTGYLAGGQGPTSAPVDAVLTLTLARR
jgi:hypothetical protein